MKHVFAICIALSTSMAAWAANPAVEMKTSAGVVMLELYPEKAPKTVANFLQYVQDGFYKGTTFHRVIDEFMIQGGGFDAEMREKPTHAPIQNEADNGLKNAAGTIAMARTPNPHSASAQFFINLKNNVFLDFRSPDPQGYGYCVFGKVTKGFETVQAIAKAPKKSAGMHADVPQQPIVIESMRVVDAPAGAK